MRKIAITLLTVIMLFVVCSGVVYGDSKTIRIFIDGQEFPIVQKPIIVDDRMMIGVREIFEYLGAEVLWKKDIQEATLNLGNNTVVIKTGSNTAWVNYLAKKLDVPAQIINGRIMVPLRFMNESLGMKVEWNKELWAVEIYTDAEKKKDEEGTKEEVANTVLHSDSRLNKILNVSSSFVKSNRNKNFIRYYADEIRGNTKCRFDILKENNSYGIDICPHENILIESETYNALQNVLIILLGQDTGVNVAKWIVESDYGFDNTTFSNSNVQVILFKGPVADSITVKYI